MCLGNVPRYYVENVYYCVVYIYTFYLEVPIGISFRVQTKDDAGCPDGLVAVACRRIVVRSGVPQTTADDGDSLILALADGKMDQDLVPWAVQLLPALCLDLVGNRFGQGLESIAKVGPFLHLLVGISLGRIQFALKYFGGYCLCLVGIEAFVFTWLCSICRLQ